MGSSRVFLLDVLRGIAILLVVISHNPVFTEFRPLLYRLYALLASIGWVGVDLFFILSGYLVGGLLLKEYKNHQTIRVGHFILRRMFKIWPVYYVSVFAFILISPLITQSSNGYLTGIAGTFKNLWPNLLHVQNYFESTNSLGWLWSLGVEEHFYVLLPTVIYLFFCKLKWDCVTRNLNDLLKVLFLVVFICLAFRFITLAFNPRADSPWILVFPSHLRMDSLFAGVTIAAFEIFHNKKWQSLRPYRFLFLAIGILLALTPLLRPSSHQMFFYPFGLSILLAGFSLIVLFSSYCKVTTDEVKTRYYSLAMKPLVVVGLVLMWIGVRSYSIYVWHGFWAKPISRRLCEFLKLDPHQLVAGSLQEFIYILVPIILGAISFYVIEEPFIKIRQKHYR